MSEELQGWIAEILAKFHCVSQDTANNWLNLGEGVTWRIVWEKLLAERQPAFGAQRVQFKNTWSVDRKKSENRPTLAAYEAASGRVEPLVTYPHSHCYCRRHFRVRPTRP